MADMPKLLSGPTTYWIHRTTRAFWLGFALGYAGAGATAIFLARMLWP